jgi:hypothetical protein
MIKKLKPGEDNQELIRIDTDGRIGFKLSRGGMEFEGIISTVDDIPLLEGEYTGRAFRENVPLSVRVLGSNGRDRFINFKSLVKHVGSAESIFAIGYESDF